MSFLFNLREIVRLLNEIYNALLQIDFRVYNIEHKLFPEPTALQLTVEGFDMGAPISKPVGQTVTFTPTEFDTTTTPPTPFPIVPANQAYTQDTTAVGVLVVNPDGTASLTGTSEGVVTVTDTDSKSNPNQVLTDSVVVTFFVPAEVPNQLILTAS